MFDISAKWSELQTLKFCLEWSDWQFIMFRCKVHSFLMNLIFPLQIKMPRRKKVENLTVVSEDKAREPEKQVNSEKGSGTKRRVVKRKAADDSIGASNTSGGMRGGKRAAVGAKGIDKSVDMSKPGANTSKGTQAGKKVPAKKTAEKKAAAAGRKKTGGSAQSQTVSSKPPSRRTPRQAKKAADGSLPDPNDGTAGGDLSEGNARSRSRGRAAPKEDPPDSEVSFKSNESSGAGRAESQRTELAKSSKFFKGRGGKGGATIDTSQRQVAANYTTKVPSRLKQGKGVKMMTDDAIRHMLNSSVEEDGEEDIGGIAAADGRRKRKANEDTAARREQPTKKKVSGKNIGPPGKRSDEKQKQGKLSMYKNKKSIGHKVQSKLIYKAIFFIMPLVYQIDLSSL